MAMRSSFSPFSSSDSSSSLLTVGDHLCSAFLPFIGIIETLIFVVTDCFQCHPTPLFRRPQEPCHDFSKLAVESRCFTVSEVEALHELFKKLSSSIIEDGRMHKEELQMALFRTPIGENLFVNRVKQMLVVVLVEFDMALPDELLEAIIDKAFEDADAKKDGKIDRDEWKDFVIRHPPLLKNMTLPHLKDLTAALASSVFNTEVEDKKTW